MFQWCNFWCRFHGICTNTTNGECAGLSLPDEEGKYGAEGVMDNAKKEML